MPASVYILQSSNGSFYVGSTIDLNRRLIQHLSGHTRTTKKRNIYKLVFSQKYPNLLQARRIERKIKNLKRKDYIEKIIKDGYIKIR